MIQQRVTTPVPTNHVLHLLLTLLTCGLWLFVWLPVWAINSMRSREIVRWTETQYTPSRPVGAWQTLGPPPVRCGKCDWCTMGAMFCRQQSHPDPLPAQDPPAQ